jgi:hypothetical protein
MHNKQPMRYVIQEKSNLWFNGVLIGIGLCLVPSTLFLSINYLTSTIFVISNSNEELLKAGYTVPKYVDNTNDHNCNIWQVEGEITTVCMINGKAYFPVD